MHEHKVLTGTEVHTCICVLGGGGGAGGGGLSTTINKKMKDMAGVVI